MAKPHGFSLAILAVFYMFWISSSYAEQPDPHEPISIRVDSIELRVRTVPALPQEERFLGEWKIEINTIDDNGQTSSPTYYGHTSSDGDATVTLPEYLLSQPMVIKATNKMLPPFEGDSQDIRLLEVFIPPYCYDKTTWYVGPVEDALWSFYKEAAANGAEAWNPSQVDCHTWFANYLSLVLSDEVNDALESQDPDLPFEKEAVLRALQQYPSSLVPTRPPVCLAESRHRGGNLEPGAKIILNATNGLIRIDDTAKSHLNSIYLVDQDPITVGPTFGTVESICSIKLADKTLLKINAKDFSPQEHFWLDQVDFFGTIHWHQNILPELDATVYHTRAGNGRAVETDAYDDACAVTSLVEFVNISQGEQSLRRGTGIYFSNLFEDSHTVVHLTSDGDAVVDNHDSWVIFKRDGDEPGHEAVIAVELLGVRQGDYRDAVHMSYDTDTENLFVGLREKYELNGENIDGEKAYLKYSVHVWDGSSRQGQRQIRKDLANCYESADIWARQFFRPWDSSPSPLLAAESAVRSQCFSNSPSNQRWLTEEAGLWYINNDKGVRSNIIVNPGWLAPHMSYEIFIQKFYDDDFAGPRAVAQTDAQGQLMLAMPIVVEGDRVRLRLKDSFSNEADLDVNCVSEFTGFVGMPGIPYIPRSQEPDLILTPAKPLLLPCPVDPIQEP